MEKRMTILETKMDHIAGSLTDIKVDICGARTDYKQLLWAGIGAYVSILGILAAGYFRLSDRSDHVFDKVSDVQITLERIGNRIGTPATPAKQPPQAPTPDPSSQSHFDDGGPQP